MKNKICLMTLLALSSLGLGKIIAGPPSEADVGDPDSFRHNAFYMGVASGQVILASDCTGVTPPTQCYTLPLPGNTFTANDICHINLPNGSTKDIIYPALSFFHSYRLDNSTGTSQIGQFDYTASITIDSTALNDPACIDPSTGLQCGGHLSMEFADNRFTDQHNMNPGDFTRGHLNYSHVGNLGITARSLEESGIPHNIVQHMFQGPMVLHLNITGSVLQLSNASITGNMRLFGD